MNYLGILRLLVFAILAPSVVYAADNLGGTGTSEIQRQVAKYKATPNSQREYGDEIKLEELICSTPLENITDGDIASLMDLVKGGDGVQITASAIGLASIGPKAARAIPVLEEALKKTKAEEESERMMGSLTSDYIEVAIAILKDNNRKRCLSVREHPIKGF